VGAGPRGAARPRPGMDDPREHRGPGAPACGRGQRGPGGEARGRSRGGFGPEIPILVDAPGDPVESLGTAGQESDVTRAEPLINGHPDAVVAAAEGQGSEAVIPPGEDRKKPRD
jgi:hypothetical protein